jgi:hypothetical protein
MKLSSQRGSLMIITMIFVIILTVAAVSVLELSATSYRLSMRNQLQAEARAVGESEMEYLYYRFKAQVLAGTAAQGAPTALALLNVCDNSADATTTFTPFLAAHSAAGWRVKRALVTDRYLQNERFPGTTKEGNFTYLIAHIEIIPPASSPFGTTANVRIGRRFMNSSAPIFQYSIFFQGDLEFNPGGAITTTISGDVVANGSIYMGPQSGGTMMLNGKVRYLNGRYFNVTSGGTTSYSNPDAPTPQVTLVAPTFATSQASQLETMDEPENLLGGIDVTVTAIGRPDLFGPPARINPAVWTAAELITAENNVYRSLIVPPPSASTYGTATSEYPNGIVSTVDDAVISVQRAHNRANLVITVDVSTGTVVFTKINPQNGVSTNATLDFNDPLISPVVTNNGTALLPVWTKSVYDLREASNVTVVELDISILKTKLEAARDTSLRALGTADTALGYFDFRGLVYVNLKGASVPSPAAIRLINGTNLPYNESASNVGGLGGFSIATNGGIYVKGDYNTSAPVRALAPNIGSPVYPRSEDGTAGHVPAMLIADCITLLSSAWNDANAAAALTSRVATSGTTYLNAGLLTGNIPATPTTTSGGAQNLVRYLENWSGRSVNFFGSIGRLFTSTIFNAPYGGVGSVYNQPNRSFTFDHNILLYAPPGTPNTTSFSRGSFFTW